MPDVKLAGVTLSDPDLTQGDVDIAWGAIQDACGWHVAPVEEHELVLDSRGGPVLPLPSLRVVEVLGVWIDGADVTADVEWSQNGLLRLSRGRSWPVGYRRIKVRLRHGYEALPASLGALVKRNALNVEGGPKQVMAGPFLEINRDEDADGAYGFSKAAKAVLARYTLEALPS